MGQVEGMAPRKQPNPIDVHVGSRLKMRRTMIGMTQEKLGDQLGVTFQQVQKYEKGANRIGASRLQEIARILSVPVSYFFDEAQGLGSVSPTVDLSSQPAYGFAEDADTFETARPSSAPSEARELATAFSRIGDPRVRRRIIDLVETLADGRGR